MVIRDIYTKVHEAWKNRPDKTTPVYAVDLEHIEQGISDAMDNRALKEIYGDDHIRLILPKTNAATSTYTNLVRIGYDGSDSAEGTDIHTLDREGNAYFAGDVKNSKGVSLNGLQAQINNILEGES